MSLDFDVVDFSVEGAGERSNSGVSFFRVPGCLSAPPVSRKAKAQGRHTAEHSRIFLDFPKQALLAFTQFVNSEWISLKINERWRPERFITRLRLI